MKKKSEVAVFWFRRDLRLEDNAGLYYALKSGYPVLPLFIFDETILNQLEDRKDRRVAFIHSAVESLHREMNTLGSSLFVKSGEVNQIWKEITAEFNVKEVYTNHDYELYAQKRDKQVGQMLNELGVPFYTFKDQVVFEKNEILSNSGGPYTVFTPYSRKWKEKLSDFFLKPYPVYQYINQLLKLEPMEIPSLASIGFESDPIAFKRPVLDEELISEYHLKRDIPAVKGTSHLSVHLRFGTISIRKLASLGLKLNETWLNELIWRDFYMNILWHFPHINEGRSFKKDYENIRWRNNTEEFERWCNGTTGFPIVDAGMRELNATGFMHNRVRMITASFLCKDLLIDWRWGEAYFANKLMDFDFSANNGGWQWASGSGCDAAPYFRIFNPDAQTQKFDKDLKYIRKWIPEYNTPDYPKPVVDHKIARDRTLAAYKKALEKS
jgi:deoxyribodipyrimidine photo-lyase